MAAKEKSIDKWLNAAYELFAEVGPEAMNVKALSEACDLPRTNFYYHFVDMDDLIERLLHDHLEREGKKMRLEFEQHFDRFIPDLYDIIANNKQIIRFHWQLFRHRDDFRFNQAFLFWRKKNSEIIIPKIMEYYKLDLPIMLMQSIWDTVNDAWFSQLDFNKFSSAELSKSADETMRSVLAFTKHKG